MINFGSSIGLEAVLTGKVMINPKFLHENDTVFDEEAGVETTHSIEETTELLSELLSDENRRSQQGDSRALVDQEIFASAPNKHPIDRYRESIPLGQ